MARGVSAFLRELFRDAEYERALLRSGDFLGVANRVLRRHADSLATETFLDRWLAESIEPSHALLAVLPRLRTARIYLASNQEPLRGAHVEQLYAHHGWLTGTFFSCRIGHRKPDAAYFEHLLHTHRLPPGQLPLRG